MNQRSAADGSDGYYGYSPLTTLSDSYFSQEQYYGENEAYARSNNPTLIVPSIPPQGIGQAQGQASASSLVSAPFRYSPAVNFSDPSNFAPFYTEGQMDIELLSAEKYKEGGYPQVNTAEAENNVQFGGLLASNEGSPATMPTRRTSKKETSKSTSADEAVSTRQRGRPRLDTRDQTAAEVSLLLFFGSC